MQTYEIQKGDTLYSIAQRLGVSVQRIAAANNIFYPCQIVAGMELIIPTHKTAYESMLRGQGQKNDIDQIRKIFGQEGSTIGEVIKFSFLRYDLRVYIGDILVEPDLAFTSWVAFKQLGNYYMIMGDLVLLESEVNAVMSSLANNGIEITALHNHLIQESPKVMYLHIEGKGNPIELSQHVVTALSLTKTPLGVKGNKPLTQIDWSQIEDIIGHKGSHKGKVLQMSIPRILKVTEEAMQIPASMGIAHAVNFQLEGNEAASTGDFVLLSNEVNPVVKSLRDSGITVTAVHNHMLYETPRLFFLHFWAVEQPERLAMSLKNALELAK